VWILLFAGSKIEIGMETAMDDRQHHPRFPANWGVRFVCDCRKQSREINIHRGVAHELSTLGVRILSDHHICHKKKIAMQLIIPAAFTGVPQKIIRIIGNSITTVMHEGRFLTEIEFLHFEGNGLNELDRNLRIRFMPRPLA
jgi:hypothetical protein